MSTDGIQNINHTGRNISTLDPAEYVDTLKATRDEIVADDVTINALVIEDPADVTPNAGYPSLGAYHWDTTVGGSDGFSVNIQSFADMKTAMKEKLTQEFCNGVNF